MPKWTDGLVDAFPIPVDDFEKLRLEEQDAATAQTQQYEYSGLFPFFSLPAELRNRIYNLVLFSKPDYRGANGKRKGPRLASLLVSKQFHHEASYALYTTHKFLIFPIQLFTALPTIQELPSHYRALVTNLELVVGSSWTSPPKSWRLTKGLARCLSGLQNVQTLSIFVDFDPSHPTFEKYRISKEFYTDFCGELVEDVLEAMPRLQYVQLDGNNGVDVHGPLVSRLREETLLQNKKLRWGKQAGWAHKFDEKLVPEEFKVSQPDDTNDDEGANSHGADPASKTGKGDSAISDSGTLQSREQSEAKSSTDNHKVDKPSRSTTVRQATSSKDVKAPLRSWPADSRTLKERTEARKAEKKAKAQSKAI